MCADVHWCVCLCAHVHLCVRRGCLLHCSQIETWKKRVGRWWQEWSEPVVSWRPRPDVSHTEPQKSAAHFSLITRIFNQGRWEDGGRNWGCVCVCVRMRLPVCTNVCVECLCLLGKSVWVCVLELGWDLWFITLIGDFETAALRKVKEGEVEWDDREKEAWQTDSHTSHHHSGHTNTHILTGSIPYCTQLLTTMPATSSRSKPWRLE